MTSLLLASLLAAAPALASGEADADAATRPDPSPSQEALYRALSIRDPAPSCSDLSALSEDLVTDLGFLVDHADQPAWVGMRAAGCLITDHHEAARSRIEGWLSGEHTKGYAILVVTQLDRLPEPVAVDLAQKGLAGPHATSLRSRIARSELPAIRQLAED